jgi:2-polyprenyl-3-methyl-5-hydroxy-6-metoxy-1,4-benzoquinol methylase
MSASWRDHPPAIDPEVRRAFLDARRRSHSERMTEIHAPSYDTDWGAISPSHETFVGRFLDLVRPKGTILDAACGTGKYWPLVLGSGRTVVGVDQSIGMLGVAARKFPEVPMGCVGLQDLQFVELFDGVMCVDAIENVGPEDWPVVLARLREAARHGTYLYLTVEVIDEADAERAYEEARAKGAPVIPGEDFDGLGYHHYLERSRVGRWLGEAGLETVASDVADLYLHLLLRRP